MKVTATNSDGSGVATSDQTTAVLDPGPAQTFGPTTIGALSASGSGGFLDVSGPYALSTPAAVSKLTGYVGGGANAGSLRAVIYADNAGQPGAFAGVSSEVVLQAGAAAGWVNFPFPTNPSLAPGSYWLGYWHGATNGAVEYFDTVANSERFVAAPGGYSNLSDPPSTFGSAATGSGKYSLYATFTPAPPVVDAPPTISGTTAQGQTLTADPGTWEGAPAFTYQWRTCNPAGASCSNIAGATSQDVRAPAERRRTDRTRGRDGNELARQRKRNLGPDGGRDGDSPRGPRNARTDGRRAR